MSRGQDFSRFKAGIQSALETNVGPVEEEDCAVDHCPDDAVYRVPWPAVGGDVAYCPYHLARYREQHPELCERVEEATGDDLSAFATRGDRFLSREEIPPQIRGGWYRRVGLTELGYALYEQTTPDEGGLVTYVLVNRDLDYQDGLPVPSARAGTFLNEFHSERGISEWDADAREALYGSGGEL